jgi:DUF1680 family protein
VCYYLSSPENESTPQATTYRRAVDELVDMIVAAQQPDGYLNVYFTVVDPEGRFKNLRDMHEMCECGRAAREGGVGRRRMLTGHGVRGWRDFR